MASWRTGTTKQYHSYLRRWQEFCSHESIQPHNPGTVKAIELLTELVKSGLGYSAINTARSALSPVIVPTNGMAFGKDPSVCRFLKGVFEIKPCLPKYSRIWDLNRILSYLKQFSSIQDIQLKDMTMNLTTLLCVLTGQRCQTIHKIDVDFIQFQQDGCNITIIDILKHTKAGKHQPPLRLLSYPQDK